MKGSDEFGGQVWGGLGSDEGVEGVRLGVGGQDLQVMVGDMQGLGVMVWGRFGQSSCKGRGLLFWGQVRWGSGQGVGRSGQGVGVWSGCGGLVRV